MRSSNSVRHAGDDLDLEVKAREPVHADRRPVRIGRLRENLALYSHDRAELVFGISMERCDVDDIVESASARLQRRLEIGEGQPDLSLEARLGRTIAAAPDLARYEQEIA